MAVKPRVLDMSGVDENGGNYPTQLRVTEGDYRAVITDVRDHTSKSGLANWVFRLQLVALGTRATYDYYTQIEGESKKLWKVFGIFRAAGQSVRAGKAKLDPNTLIGKEIGVSMIDSEYNGKLQSAVNSVFTADRVIDSALPDVDTSTVPGDEGEYEDIEDAEVVDDGDEFIADELDLDSL